MKKNTKTAGRRNFIRNSAGLIAGFGMLPMFAESKTYLPPENVNIIGPLEGFSPQIGTFVSMLHWMRNSVVNAVKGLTTEELDFQIDAQSNSIGALLLHLAATEVVYQDLTFYSLKDFSAENKKKWEVAMNLGEEGRKHIKGNGLDYYLARLKEVRDTSLTEFKKSNDKWLIEIDPSFFGNQPTNNYCKWFHVCEHEANHRGQITLIRKRLPGSKGGD
ncbi:MAG: DinB family protein [Ferruginibacter sp.]|nr:DinB family protein [Ferruginibacter sp.]